ncbi:thermonuclease family protein [Rhodococcus koreensis]|uniref:thermonuclease family protein n=1 Tax=Rhodococcus koreensis TaxID=99653 RepID=UPI0036DA5817
MNKLKTSTRVVCCFFAALFALTAASAFVELDILTGLFLLILAGVCLYFAAFRQQVVAARERRIEQLRVAARTNAEHQAAMTGHDVPPAPIIEPPKRGKLVGVGVAVTLLLIAYIGGSRTETPVDTSADGAPDTTTAAQPPATSEPPATTSNPAPPTTADTPAAGTAASVPVPAVGPSPEPDRRAATATVVATATVTQIIDGDTIEVQDDANGALTIRVLGIDTPETKKPGHTVACWGPEASSWAQEQLDGERVALVADSTQDATDAYGRTLVYVVKPDGWDYSVESARAGMAKSYIYNSPVTRHPQIVAAEQNAIASGRGLWGPPCNGNSDSVPQTPEPAPPPVAPAPVPAPYVPPPQVPSPPPPPVPAPYVPPPQVPSPPPPPPPPPPAYTVVYPNCAAARAAGAAPLYAGSPGYSLDLDRDRDGIACET